MRRLIIFGLALSCAWASVATAEPYWIAYEGNDFPENEGWTRVYGDEQGQWHGGAERWIEDGALVIDSLRHNMIVDFYNMSRLIDPDTGELFLMCWRFKPEIVLNWYDPTVGVVSDDFRAVAFAFSESEAISVFEPNVSLMFEPGMLHSFELRSTDMLEYELFVDGTLSVAGEFVDVFEASRVAWGDGVQGASSLSRWDYFRFGVVSQSESEVEQKAKPKRILPATMFEPETHVVSPSGYSDYDRLGTVRDNRDVVAIRTRWCNGSRAGEFRIRLAKRKGTFDEHFQDSAGMRFDDGMRRPGIESELDHLLGRLRSE